MDPYEAAKVYTVLHEFHEAQVSGVVGTQSVARSKGSLAICARLPTLQETVEHDNACCHRDHHHNDEDVADHATHDRGSVLLKVKLVVLVAARTEDLASLDNLGRQTVRMERIVLASARLDELWRDPQQRQIALPFHCICPENFQKL